MEQQQEKKKEWFSEWSSARIIFGRLIAIDKRFHQITIEYKEGEEWQSKILTTPDWTDEEWEPVLEMLGEEAEFSEQDGKIVWIDRETH